MSNQKYKSEQLNNEGNLICYKCEQYLPINNFGPDNKNSHRLYKRHECQSCRKKGEKQWFKNCSEEKQLYKLFVQRLCGVNQRAKDKGYIVDIDNDYLFELYYKQEGKCALTGIELACELFVGERILKNNISIDRIDSSKGYTKDNIQLVCAIINQMKSNLDIIDFINICKKVVENYES